jgi:hypothetical protein
MVGGIKNHNKNQIEELHILKESSFYNDFYIEGEKVYIECKITIKNNSNNERSFKLHGDFKEDVQLGLLKNENLIGYRQDLNTTEFTVDKKSKQFFTVTFIGDFAGNNKRYNRNLPKIRVELIE